ncbi:MULTISPECIES: N-acetylmuramoyl-L-alanine amidase family protein [unclassified Leptospira]|uniref:peptidoglycan recognition protein family protein n=1 Tax=unclassified Leptospira TaxID=2633828 RepID=UPI000519AC7E|nr:MULTISPECIES: peptidoglycan recognition family protein [unclassified Leptospira]
MIQTDLRIKQDFLTPNPHSRPGDKIKEVKGIVLHWTATPKATAQNIRDYFESLKAPEGRFASAHFVVGLVGEIVQCIPLDEIAYHCGSKTYTPEKEKRLGPDSPNFYTIGIEQCVSDMIGKFTEKTLSSASRLTAQLCVKYDLDANDLWTHQGIVGWKDCPRWYNTHPQDWIVFKKRVDDLLKKQRED